MKLNIINKDNEKGTMLETYGNGFYIPKAPLVMALISVCVITPCTNWAIPFINKYITGVWVRW